MTNSFVQTPNPLQANDLQSGDRLAVATSPNPTPSSASPKLPRISIVVPNYQGGATIGQTLQSLVDQNYPDLEIIVVDGGSTDHSVEVIQQFAEQITWWVSEPDRGQSHAINKGFSHCTGDIVNWLCSDDLLAPGALMTIGQQFAEFPEIDVLVGCCRIEYLTTDNTVEPLKETSFWISQLQRFIPLGTLQRSPTDDRAYIRSTTLEQIQLMPASVPIYQPACFYRRSLINRSNPVDERYVYTMDIELFNYFHAQGVSWKTIPDVLCIAIISGQNKSSVAGVKATYELEQIYTTYAQEKIPLTYWHRKLRYPLERFLKLQKGSLWVYLVGPLWIVITLLLAPFYGLKRSFALRWTAWV
ncbi:MAG: glycosyltransferase [Oculatellaceae cyanobacterium Prado106]|jgi:glycosyltransferase involved in cell wall biosynthesis|nr:glycosyltransferase [Oculatellaceae cyanobacterium Prado106]